MAKTLNITIADKVFDEINLLIEKQKISNKSGFIEEIIRVGLLYSYNINITKEVPKKVIKLNSVELIEQMMKLPKEEIQTLALYCKKQLNKRFDDEGKNIEGELDGTN